MRFDVLIYCYAGAYVPVVHEPYTSFSKFETNKNRWWENGLSSYVRKSPKWAAETLSQVEEETLVSSVKYWTEYRYD